MTVLILIGLGILSAVMGFFGASDFAWGGVSLATLRSMPEILAIPAFITVIVAPRVGATAYWGLLALAVILDSTNLEVVLFFLATAPLAQYYAACRASRSRQLES